MDPRDGAANAAMQERLPHGVYCEVHQVDASDASYVYCRKVAGHADSHHFGRSRRS